MKILLTGGCSFSQIIDGTSSKQYQDRTWPLFLAEKLNPIASYNNAIGGQGNDLISRQIIWKLTELLKTVDPDDILVGIMWTDQGRHSTLVNFDDAGEFNHGQIVLPYQRNSPLYKFYKDRKYYNPYMWIDDVDHAGWGILRDSHNLGKMYYRSFWNNEQSQILTLEHILRVQWFLKLHKIKYFMTTYMQTVLEYMSDSKLAKHLYDEVDFDHFLPVKGEYNWVKDNGLTFRDEQGHPTAESHEAFVNQVIIPFLQQKNYIQ